MFVVNQFIETVGLSVATQYDFRIRRDTLPDKKNYLFLSVEWNGRMNSPLGLSGRSTKRILHQDLKVAPYKIVLVQELSKGENEVHRNFCQDKIAGTGLKPTPRNSICGHSI